MVPNCDLKYEEISPVHEGGLPLVFEDKTGESPISIRRVKKKMFGKTCIWFEDSMGNRIEPPSYLV